MSARLPLGGFLFSLGRAFPFAADALSYTLAFSTLLAIRSDFQDARTAPRRRLQLEIAEGVRWLWGQGFLRANVLLTGASNFVSNALALVIIVLALRQGASSTMIGVIFALAALGGLVGAAVAPGLQRRIHPAHVVVGYQAMYALLVPLLAIAPPLALGGLLAAMLVGSPTWNAVFGAYKIAMIPDRLLGRVDSVGGLVTAGAAPLGALSAGLLLEGFGPSPTVFVFAAISATAAAAGLASRSIRRVPDLTAIPPNTADPTRPGSDEPPCRSP